MDPWNTTTLYVDGMPVPNQYLDLYQSSIGGPNGVANISDARTLGYAAYGGGDYLGSFYETHSGIRSTGSLLSEMNLRVAGNRVHYTSTAFPVGSGASGVRFEREGAWRALNLDGMALSLQENDYSAPIGFDMGSELPVWTGGPVGVNAFGLLGQDGGDGRTIIYQRTTATDNSTIGNFSIPGTDINGFFLEPAGPSTTTPNLDRRIPAGIYNLEWNTGPRYPDALRLYNDQVPRSRAILIHRGNSPENTLGCLLPGCSSATDFVGNSRVKYNQIINHFKTMGVNGARIIIYDPTNP